MLKHTIELNPKDISKEELNKQNSEDNIINNEVPLSDTLLNTSNTKIKKCDSSRIILIIWILIIAGLLLIPIIKLIKEEKKEITLNYDDAEKILDSEIIKENHNLLIESENYTKELISICDKVFFFQINETIGDLPKNLDFLINATDSSLQVAKDDIELYNSTFYTLSHQANYFTNETSKSIKNFSTSLNRFKNEIGIITDQYEKTIQAIAIPLSIQTNETNQKLRSLISDESITSYKKEVEKLNSFFNNFFSNIFDISKNIFSSFKKLFNHTTSLITEIVQDIFEFKNILENMTQEKIHEKLKQIKENFISLKNDINNIKTNYKELKTEIQQFKDKTGEIDLKVYLSIINTLNDIITKIKQDSEYDIKNITIFNFHIDSMKLSFDDIMIITDHFTLEIDFLLSTLDVEISTSLDLLFIMDITGSMKSYLNEAKNNILSIIEGIIEKCPGIDINLGFIGYRDFYEEYIDIDFTQQHSTVKNIINRAYASGGGDIPEDVAFALELAVNKTWKSNAKFAVFIADAPGHGKQYGGEDYEGTAPSRRLIEEMIGEMAAKDISLFCLKIRNITDIMYALFEEIYMSTKSIQTKFIIVDNSEEGSSFSNVVVNNAIEVYYQQRKSLNKECLMTKNSAIEILKSKYGINEAYPDINMRFILGKCNPVLLIPGIYSTKLMVEFNCKGLATEERSTTLKEIRIYCGDLVCKDETKTKEEHFLIFSKTDKAFSFDVFKEDKYNSCLGLIANYFRNENECPKVDKKNICFYSKHVKVGYYGGTPDSLQESRCGVAGIQDVVHGSFLANLQAAGCFKKISNSLIKLGYKEGFSLGALPNDYRRYLSTNNFATNVFKSQIERLYKNTGKPVVIVAHSFGTLLTLTNLLKNQNNETFMKKIKKFVAIAPPFSGSSELLDIFLHSTKSFDHIAVVINTNFNAFGQYLMYKSLPTVVELRPLSIASKIFADSSYEELGNALKGRLDLERDCKTKECDISEIEAKTTKFDNIFEGYFPSLLDSECSYESKIGGSKDALSNKCYTNIYNVGDCPSIITKSVNPTKDQFEKDAYCNKFGSSYFYQGECTDSKRNCLDKMYYSNKCPNVYSNTKAVEFMLGRYNEQFSKEYGEVDESYFEKHETIRKGVENSIKYQNEISLIKDLPVPPVDTELVYTSYIPTVASLVLDDDDFTKEGEIFKKGGDGTVPTWSSLLTGLKWVYEKKKENLPQKIKLIEYCSRLAQSGKYKYDPNKEQNFAALSCNCLSSSNNYKNEKCKHADMLSDDSLIKYIHSVVEDLKEINTFTDSKEKAIKDYNQKFDYMGECSNDIYNILNTVK